MDTCCVLRPLLVAKSPVFPFENSPHPFSVHVDRARLPYLLMKGHHRIWPLSILSLSPSSFLATTINLAASQAKQSQCSPSNLLGKHIFF